MADSGRRNYLKQSRHVMPSNAFVQCQYVIEIETQVQTDHLSQPRRSSSSLSFGSFCLQQSQTRIKSAASAASPKTKIQESGGASGCKHLLCSSSANTCCAGQKGSSNKEIGAAAAAQLRQQHGSNSGSTAHSSSAQQQQQQAISRPASDQQMSGG